MIMISNQNVTKIIKIIKKNLKIDNKIKKNID